MAKQSVDPSFVAVIDGIVEKRNAWLNQLVSGQSELMITVRNSKQKFPIPGFYLRHDKTSVTIKTAKEIMDYLFRGKDFFFPLLATYEEEATFNFLDVTIKKM